MNPEKQKLAILALIVTVGLVACNKPDPDESGANQMESTGDPAVSNGDSMSEQSETAGEVLEDSAITAKVKTALMSEPGLDSLDINVETMMGVVTLTGSADTAEHKAKAEQVVAAVSGVKQVQNQLVVSAN